jgi:Protein of unknown function (DUF2459)
VSSLGRVAGVVALWPKSGLLRLDVRCCQRIIAATVMLVLNACSTPLDRLASVENMAVSGPSLSIIERGWHTDVALRAEDLTGPVAALRQTFPGARFLVFGFGDHAFYMSRDETFLGMLAALFPGQGVVLVTGLRTSPVKAFGADHVVTLRLSCAQRSAIDAFIGRALIESGEASIQRLGDGPYPGSVFYGSSEEYHAFHDCNYWTIAALQSAGFSVSPAGVFFSSQTMNQARRIAKAQHFDPPRSDPHNCTLEPSR